MPSSKQHLTETSETFGDDMIGGTSTESNEMKHLEEMNIKSSPSPSIYDDDDISVDDSHESKDVDQASMIAQLKEERDMAMLEAKELRDRLKYVMEAIQILTKTMKESHYNSLTADNYDIPITATSSFINLSSTSTMEEEEEEEETTAIPLSGTTNKNIQHVNKTKDHHTLQNHHYDSDEALLPLGSCSTEIHVHDPSMDDEDTPPNSNTTTPIGITTTILSRQDYGEHSAPAEHTTKSSNNKISNNVSSNRLRTHSGISTSSSIATYTSRDSKRFSELVSLSSSNNYYSSYMPLQYNGEDEEDGKSRVDLTKVSSDLVALSDACRMVGENACWINDEASVSLQELSKANEKYLTLKDEYNQMELCAKRLYKKNKALRLTIEKEKMDKKILVKEIKALLKQLEEEGQRSKMMRGLELYMIEAIMKHERILTERGNDTEWMNLPSTPGKSEDVEKDTKPDSASKKKNKLGFLGGALGFHGSKKASATNINVSDKRSRSHQQSTTCNEILSNESSDNAQSASTTLQIEDTSQNENDPSLASAVGLQYPEHLPPMTPPPSTPCYDSSSFITPISPSITNTTDISKSPTFQAMVQGKIDSKSSACSTFNTTTTTVTEDHFLPVLKTSMVTEHNPLDVSKLSDDTSINDQDTISRAQHLRRKGRKGSPEPPHLRCLAIPHSLEPPEPQSYSVDKDMNTAVGALPTISTNESDDATSPNDCTSSENVTAKTLPKEKSANSSATSRNQVDDQERGKTIPHFKNCDSAANESIPKNKDTGDEENAENIPLCFRKVVADKSSSNSTNVEATNSAKKTTQKTKMVMGLKPKVKPRKTKLNSFYELFAYD